MKVSKSHLYLFKKVGFFGGISLGISYISFGGWIYKKKIYVREKLLKDN